MRVRFGEILLATGLLAIILLGIFLLQNSPHEYLRVSFLDVGQGDSTLFQTPNGGKVLVDGGRDNAVLTRLGEELPWGTKTLELVIATHDDADHIQGLVGVLKKYNVKVLAYSLPNSTNPISKELMRLASEKNVKVIHVTKPMIVKTSDGLLVKFLFPVKNMDLENSTNQRLEVDGNSASVVTQFIFGQNSFLLTGDLPQSGELYLVKKYSENLQSNVIKLGHHGSDSSTHPAFLQNTRPNIAIVSAGKNNSFGHPHRSVLELVQKFGVTVLRTDETGTIRLTSNGINIWRD